MSIHAASARDRFRPESAQDFSQRSRRLSKWLGLSYQRSQELLARIYGYSDFHELHVQLRRPGTPGPFEDPQDSEYRSARLIAEFKGINELQLTARDRAVASLGFFRHAAQHRAIFNALAEQDRAAPAGYSGISNALKSSKPRRVVMAPPPSHPALAGTVLDVECAEDEDVEWLWTETPAGRCVSGYRLVSR
jgi:hypothetical protein